MQPAEIAVFTACLLVSFISFGLAQHFLTKAVFLPLSKAIKQDTTQPTASQAKLRNGIQPNISLLFLLDQFPAGHKLLERRYNSLHRLHSAGNCTNLIARFIQEFRYLLVQIFHLTIHFLQEPFRLL